MMMIEIVGSSFGNKGDALMAIAIEQRLGAYHQIVHHSKTQEPRWLRRFMNAVNTRLPRRMQRSRYYIAHLLPKFVRSKWKIVRYKDIGAVLDSSGFQYGDKWLNSAYLINWRRDHYKKLKQLGKKIILLPQAFGPFEIKFMRDLMISILQNVDLVYARDIHSFHYLQALKISSVRMKIAPDFTNLIVPNKPIDDYLWVDRVCIVPNYRMLDKTTKEARQRYLTFLLKCIKSLRNRNLNPVLLLHNRGDYRLAELLNKEASDELPIIDEDPLTTKGILACCHSAISSRYHALVSCLSQGTPCLGTSWAHKYPSLFEEYDCPECLLDLFDSDQEIENKISLLTDASKRNYLINKVKQRAEMIKQRTINMWLEVENLLQS